MVVVIVDPGNLTLKFGQNRFSESLNIVAVVDDVVVKFYVDVVFHPEIYL